MSLKVKNLGIENNLMKNIMNFFHNIKDPREKSNATKYSLYEILISAFSVFFMQDASFLANQRRMENIWHKSNVKTLFKVEKIPTAAQIRKTIDEINTQEIIPLLDTGLEIIREYDGLKEYAFLENSICVVIDGTEFYSSSNISCNSCMQKTRNGKVTYSHGALLAAIVSANTKNIIPLRPEFIGGTNDSNKEDCENLAFKRWFEKNKNYYKDLNMTIIADALYSKNSICKLLIENNTNFIFVCKEKGNKTLFEYVLKGDMKIKQEKIRKDYKTYKYIYSYQNNLPIRDDEDAESVNFLEYEIIEVSSNKKIYYNSFITNFELNDDNVKEIAEAGRARWKIENENNNTLKTKGYNFEHNYGHGRKNLSNNFAVLILTAFLFHNILDLFSELYQKAKATSSKKAEFFDEMKIIMKYKFFYSVEEIFQTILDPENNPIFTVHARPPT